MIKNLPQQLEYKETPEGNIARWAWDSHYWIEKEEGYWTCKWCDAIWTSEMGLSDKYNYLCKGNPLLKKLAQKEEDIVPQTEGKEFGEIVPELKRFFRKHKNISKS